MSEFIDERIHEQEAYMGQAESTPRFLEENIVFTKALEYQLELNKSTYFSHEAALTAALEYAFILDERVKNDNLLNQPASIVGDNIVAPDPTLDSRLGSYDIHTGVLHRDASDMFEQPSFKGDFIGFTPYALPTPEDANRFKAYIGYQLTIAPITAPNFIGTLVAFGDVATTSIEFWEDTKKKDADAAKEILLGIENRSTASVINEVDSLLSGPEQFEQNSLRNVGRLIRRHLTGNKHMDKKHQDAMLDLIKSRLGLYNNEVFFVEAISAIQPIPSKPFMIMSAPQARMRVSDVLFAPYFWNTNNEWTIDTQCLSPAIATEQIDGETGEKFIMNIPFEKLKVLRPTKLAPSSES